MHVSNPLGVEFATTLPEIAFSINKNEEIAEILKKCFRINIAIPELEGYHVDGFSGKHFLSPIERIEFMPLNINFQQMNVVYRIF